MQALSLFWILLYGLGQAPAPGQASEPARPSRTYRGQVVDPGRRPLVGATVFVKGTRTAVTTNSEGVFVLTLPAGTFELLVDYPGHLAPAVRVGTSDSVLLVTLYSTQPRARRR